MNLTDLRAELDARATEADDHLTDLVPGTRRKIRQTKQRRIAGALGGTAVVALLAAGLILPGLTSTAPDPADPPPADYVKDGITFQGMVDNDRLDKAWIGKPGENPLEFTWTPTTNNVALRSVCRTTASTPKSVRLWINSRLISDFDCSSDTNVSGQAVRQLDPSDALWVDAPIGKRAMVRVSIVDQTTNREGDSSAQLALGIYNSPVQTVDEVGVPSRIAPASPDDVSKDGIRYRAKVGGDTLAAAAVGDAGQGSVQLTFRPTGAPLTLHSFCTANDASFQAPKYDVVIRIGTKLVGPDTCFADTTDVGTASSHTIAMPASSESVRATITLVDKHGKPATVKGARIALGVYYQGAQRVVTAADGHQVSLNEVTEANGYRYKLAELKTADAATTRRLPITIPTDKPFILGVGSTKLGNSGLVNGNVTGVLSDIYVTTDPTSNVKDDFGLTTAAEPAGKAGTATLVINDGRPTKGKFILAVYLPAD